MNTLDQTLGGNGAFSLFSGELIEDPFPLFAQMRSASALIPVPLSGEETNRQTWLIVRMKETVQVLKDLTHFTVDSRSIDGSNPLGQGFSEMETVDAPTFYTAKSLVTVDDPDHRRLRLLVSKAFTPRYIESLRPRVQEIADELLDRVQDQGQMDFVEDYAFPLPINVISGMLGVPQPDWPQLRAWSVALEDGLGLGRQDPGVVDHMRAFGTYIMQLVTNKRQHPADDLISQLIAVEEEGDRLSEAELAAMISLLITAGHQTTSNLIATGSLMLLDHPDQLEKLKADLHLVPTAVEELLRFNGPLITITPRFAIEDIEIAGQQIKRGDVLIPLLKSANRDETEFTQPEELDIARTLNRHIAFGDGIHTCLGAPLARLEGDIAFTTLLKRMPNLRLSVPRESITWRFSFGSPSLTALPLAF